MKLHRLAASALVTFLMIAFIGKAGAERKCARTYSLLTTFDFFCKSGVNSKLIESKYNNVTIVVSNDPVAQLVSRMVAIHLRERMGYTNVFLRTAWPFKDPNKTVETGDQTFSADCFMFHQFEAMFTMPLKAANIVLNFGLMQTEMEWMTENELFREVSDLGSLGTKKRFGWFYPKTFQQNDGAHHSMTMFANGSNWPIDFIYNASELNTKLSDIYTPTYCNGTKCAVLLTTNYFDNKFVEQSIKQQKWFVQVVYLDELVLIDLVTRLEKGQRPFLVFSAVPSIIFPSLGNYTTLSIDCTDEDALEIYRQKPLLKYFPFSGKKQDYLNNLVKSVSLNNSMAVELLNQVRRLNGTDLQVRYNHVACENVEKFVSSKIKDVYFNVSIGIWFPNDTSMPVFAGLKKAATRAINDVKKMLPTLNLELKEKPISDCSTFKINNDFVGMSYTHNILGVIGPPCSDNIDSIRSISTALSLPIMYYAAERGLFFNDGLDPMVFHMGEFQQYGSVMSAVFEELDWQHAAVIDMAESKYSEYLLASNLPFLNFSNHLPRSFTYKFATDVLLNIRRSYYRIIIADINADVAELVLCSAYQQEMTAKHGYVWILPDWVAKWWKFQKNSTYKPQCDPTNIDVVLDRHLAISHQFYAADDSFITENSSISVKNWKTNFTEEELQAPSYLGFIYDAVMAYALALRVLIDEEPNFPLYLNVNKINKMRLTKTLENTTFDGISGSFKFGRNASRLTNRVVMQWVDKRWEHVKLFEFEGSSHTKGGAPYTFHWINGITPDDGHPSVWRTVLVYVLVAFLVVIVVSYISFRLSGRRYKSEMEERDLILNKLNINPKNKAPETIPRERLKITYKIGSGQYGFVHGGHLRVTEAKGKIIQVPIAAKELKLGSTNEESIDFLYEAEVMKQLNHPNIVEFFGVSVEARTTLIIMEYMNRGDLRVYLLKRHHLVDEWKYSPSSDSEVSPKQLTGIVLDIARALSYLAQHKFVHRDVACRNCLVKKEHGVLTVKIADFGLARKMFDDDSYQTRRDIRLPRLWGAPESLLHNVHHPASDVWSFGIVLWEIITFGATPYPGLTIDQASEKIRAGQSMAIPSKASPSLTWLMKQCWNVDSKQRIGASAIVDYITNHPGMVTPCLDGLAHMRIVNGYTVNNGLDEPVVDRPVKYKVVPNEALSQSEYVDMMHVMNNSANSPLLYATTNAHIIEQKQTALNRFTTFVNKFKLCNNANVEVTRL